eukprot:2332931-Rhodomonas_salina.9
MSPFCSCCSEGLGAVSAVPRTLRILALLGEEVLPEQNPGSGEKLPIKRECGGCGNDVCSQLVDARPRPIADHGHRSSIGTEKEFHRLQVLELIRQPAVDLFGQQRSEVDAVDAPSRANTVFCGIFGVFDIRVFTIGARERSKRSPDQQVESSPRQEHPRLDLPVQHHARKVVRCEVGARLS